MIKVVCLPLMGQTMEEGAILRWFKQEGDYVRKGEVLFEVMTDKANIEVDSTEEGYLRRILVPLERPIPVNTPIAILSEDPNEPVGADAVPQAASFEMAEAVGGETQGGIRPLESERQKIFISPRARRLAREHGVPLSALAGRASGSGGRVMEADVQAYLAEHQQRVAPPAPPAASAEPPAATLGIAPWVERVPSLMRQMTAQAVTRSYREAPHVTLFVEADAELLVAMRTQLLPEVERACGLRLTYTDLLVKAVALALRRYPRMNLSWVGDKIRQWDQVNVGVAVALEDGLLLPVVREADRKGLIQIVQEVHNLVERARRGQLRPDELQEGTFTLTNLGTAGIDGFTPILTPGQAGILGVGRVAQRPAVREGQLCVRQTLLLSLSFDHRAIDGAHAAEFLQIVKNLIEEPFRWML